MALSQTGKMVDGKVVEPKRQLAMVFDLNKCLGCQTCTIACKTLWTAKRAWSTCGGPSSTRMPGKGTPRDWERWAAASTTRQPQSGQLPTEQEFGEAWDFNYDEVFYGGKGKQRAPPARGRPRLGARTGTRTRAAASTRTATTSTCRASAITARTPPASRPARAAPSTSARRTASSSSARTAARATASAWRPAPTSASTSTTSAASPEVHLLLPAHRAGRRARLRTAVPRPPALRRLPRRRERADPQAGEPVEGRPAAPPGVRHAAERLLRAAALAAAVRPDGKPIDSKPRIPIEYLE